MRVVSKSMRAKRGIIQLQRLVGLSSVCIEQLTYIAGTLKKLIFSPEEMSIIKAIPNACITFFSELSEIS